MPNVAEAVAHWEARRGELLERSRITQSGRERAGRYWKFDLDKLPIPNDDAPGEVELPRVSHPHVLATTLAAAANEQGSLFQRVFGSTAVQNTKFGALAAARARTGAFIYIPADADIAEPIVITYGAAGGAFFPYTLVLAERGSRATIVERIDAASGTFVCGAVEVVTGERSDITYASVQNAPSDVRYLMTRGVLPGRDSRMSWALAELGAGLSVGSADTQIAGEGARVEVAALFFPRGDEHVDLVTTVSHQVGHAVSETFVRAAATQRGQARYLGNIRIARDAQGSNASLRDDSLLLSQSAHIDSIPALEIAANDVKAYHGATVGAIDDEQIFYMLSRGLEAEEAERMITLGFFEPVIDRFPTDALREEIRAAVRAKA